MHSLGCWDAQPGMLDRLDGVRDRDCDDIVTVIMAVIVIVTITGQIFTSVPLT